jgi:hypothetical protein
MLAFEIVNSASLFNRTVAEVVRHTCAGTEEQGDGYRQCVDRYALSIVLAAILKLEKIGLEAKLTSIEGKRALECSLKSTYESPCEMMALRELCCEVIEAEAFSSSHEPVMRVSIYGEKESTIAAIMAELRAADWNVKLDMENPDLLVWPR